MSARALLGALGVIAVLGLGPLAFAAAPDPGSEMVHLPGGTFRAAEPTGPRNDTVTYYTVRPFLLDATEVTVAAYAECVRAGKCSPAAATVKLEGMSKADRAAWSAYCNRDRTDRPNHPVNCVDWRQAAAYCAWAGKRLPAEEELEWAARNGEGGTRYPWGNEEPGSRPCWNGDGSDVGRGNRAGTCPVGSHPASDSAAEAGAAGVKDLAGNVWEWTSSASVIGQDSRGRGGTSAKIARGGGWNDTDPARISAAVRVPDLPSWRSADLGFRCAKDR